VSTKISALQLQALKHQVGISLTKRHERNPPLKPLKKQPIFVDAPHLQVAPSHPFTVDPLPHPILTNETSEHALDRFKNFPPARTADHVRGGLKF